MNTIDEKLKKALRGSARLFGRDIDDSRLDTLIQFIKFGIVGVSSTVISYVLNILVLKLLQPYHLPWDYVAGNVVAFVLSVLWSFYWNNKYVFVAGEGKRRSLWRALLKTYASYAFTGIVLSNVLSYVWINVLGISKYVAPLINLVISVPLNFMLNRLWAFKE